MKGKTVVADSKKTYAARSAKSGLINVSDLSLLTGVGVPQLTSFAKKGFLRSYAEYHGKRFFNFEEIVAWLNETGSDDEAKRVIRAMMEAELENADCPYTIKKVPAEADGAHRVQIVWKDFVGE